MMQRSYLIATGISHRINGAVCSRCGMIAAFASANKRISSHPMSSIEQPKTQRSLLLWHVRFGWWSFLVFVTLGLVLETLHGLKLGVYMDVANGTRRLMWTLAHAHGTVLSLVHVLFGLSAGLLGHVSANRLRFIASCLTAATVLLPGGFVLSGIIVYSGDPGLSILVVPAGAVLLIVAVFVIARSVAYPADPRVSEDRGNLPAEPRQRDTRQTTSNRA